MRKALMTLAATFVSVALLYSQNDTTTITHIGDKAPVFTCRTIDGKVVDISRLQGKIILINFFATWCGPCNQELPVLQNNIWNKYKDNRSFELIIIGRQHTEKEVSDFVKNKKLSMPFAPDPDRSIFKKYATQSIPRNIIIGKDGKIIFQSTGYSETEFKKMEDFLAEKLK